MDPSKQPKHTYREDIYIKELTAKYKCYVYTQLNPVVPKDSKNTIEEGSYAIVLDSLNSVSEDARDSFRIIALAIAKKMHNNILGRDYKYQYTSILVCFMQELDVYSRSQMCFKYSIEELEKR